MDDVFRVIFTREDFEMIQQYKELIEAVDIETAIMNAISIALDDVDNR